MEAMDLHYEAIKSTFTQDALHSAPCAWCYAEAGIAWPEGNPTSTVCARHRVALGIKSKARRRVGQSLEGTN